MNADRYFLCVNITPVENQSLEMGTIPLGALVQKSKLYINHKLMDNRYDVVTFIFG